MTLTKQDAPELRQVLQDVQKFLSETLATEKLSEATLKRRDRLLQQLSSALARDVGGQPYVDMQQVVISPVDIRPPPNPPPLPPPYINNKQAEEEQYLYEPFEGDGIESVPANICDLPKTMRFVPFSGKSAPPSEIDADERDSLHRNNSEDTLLVDSLGVPGAKELASSGAKCGPLERKTPRIFPFKFRKCWGGLRGTFLHLYGKDRDPKPQKSIDLTGYEARPAPEEVKDSKKLDMAFEIVCPGKPSYQFVARTRKDKEQWMSAIETAATKVASHPHLQPETPEETYDDAGSSGSSWPPPPPPSTITLQPPPRSAKSATPSPPPPPRPPPSTTEQPGPYESMSPEVEEDIYNDPESPTSPVAPALIPPLRPRDEPPPLPPLRPVHPPPSDFYNDVETTIKATNACGSYANHVSEEEEQLIYEDPENAPQGIYNDAEGQEAGPDEEDIYDDAIVFNSQDGEDFYNDVDGQAGETHAEPEEFYNDADGTLATVTEEEVLYNDVEEKPADEVDNEELYDDTCFTTENSNDDVYDDAAATNGKKSAPVNYDVPPPFSKERIFRGFHNSDDEQADQPKRNSFLHSASAQGTLVQGLIKHIQQMNKGKSPATNPPSNYSVPPPLKTPPPSLPARMDTNRQAAALPPPPHPPRPLPPVRSHSLKKVEDEAEEMYESVDENNWVDDEEDEMLSQSDGLYVARWSFVGLAPGQLCLNRGEKVTVTARQEGDSWWTARKRGQVGRVPRVYLARVESEESPFGLSGDFLHC